MQSTVKHSFENKKNNAMYKNQAHSSTRSYASGVMAKHISSATEFYSMQNTKNTLLTQNINTVFISIK